jgi:hypothetical protein
MSDQTKIEFLEAEISRLKRRLALAGVAEQPAGDLPDTGELNRLHQMVLTEYPVLQCTPAQLHAAMRWCAYVYRRDRLDEQYAAVFWLDQCREWLRRQCDHNGVSLNAVTAAIVVSRIRFAPLTRYPYDLAFGLSLGDASRPSTEWRQTLANGLPAPTATKRAARIEQPHRMIRVGDDRSGW